MKAKVILVLCLLFLVVHQTNAQSSNTDSRLWGVWRLVQDPSFPDVEAYVLFTPNGSYGYQYIEGILYGKYSANNGTLDLNLTMEYADTVHYTESQSYEFVGSHLRIYNQTDGYGDFELYHRFTGFGFIPCPATVKSNMFVGAWGHVTYTDGSPNRMRSGPSTSSTTIDRLPEGSMYLVVGEPVCADGYTWWPINSSPSNPGNGADNSHVSGWMAEGADGVAFMEPVGWVDTNLLSHDSSVTTSGVSQIENQYGVTVYAPGTYPYAQQLGEALANGSVGNYAVDVYGLVGSSYEIVQDVKLGSNPMQLICMADSLSDLMGDKNTGTDPHYLCLVFDIAKSVIAREPVMVVVTVAVEILTHPDIYIDPWLDKINAWADSHPLIRFVCWVNPDICP